MIASLPCGLKITGTDLGRLGLSSALAADMFSQCAVAIADQIRISRKNACSAFDCDPDTRREASMQPIFLVALLYLLCHLLNGAASTWLGLICWVCLVAPVPC